MLMRLVLRILTSRISNKIVLPYLLLALCLAIAMIFVAVRLTTGALQDRMDNRLIESGQVTSDGLVAVEDQQIEQLRAMAFTEGVAEALSAGDRARLVALLRPHWANAGLATLIAFDSGGRALLSWQRAADARADTPPKETPHDDLPSWWIVQQVANERSDAFGDKFSIFRDDRLYTATPVRRDGRLVGGLMVATPLDALLERLQSRSQASVTTFYDGEGRAVATTQILVGEAVVPAIPLDVLSELAQRGNPEISHIQSVVSLNGRDYQFAYSPLRVRRSMNGFFSVALPRGFIVDTWASERLPLAVLAMLLIGAVLGVGVAISRRITRPLQDLVETARAVTGGELQRRTHTTSRDELGLLARSFNQMTERLLHLYETSRDLSTHNQVGAILAQARAAVQPLVGEASVLALLEDHDGWRIYVGDDAPDMLRALRNMRIEDDALVPVLAKHGERPTVLAAQARRLRVLRLPPSTAEVCYTALVVQGRLIGLLFLLHSQRGAFGPSVIEPLTAVTNMVATALHNTRLYLQVQQEGNRRRAILESIADGVLVCDVERNVVLMNPAAEALLQVHDWSRRRYHFNQLPLTPIVDTGALLAADGQIQARYEAHGTILRASSAVLSSAADALSGEVIVLHNISAEVALDQAKTDLIAMISHELRTPLTAIQSASDMLTKGIGGSLTPLQLELADTVRRQSQTMSALIEKAVIVAGVEAGTLELDISPVGLGIVVAAACNSLRDAAAAAGVELMVDVPSDLPLVMADARMLKVAVQQLIDNAIKYGAGAPVRVVAQRHGAGVALAVRDFGPGIDADELPHVFHRLKRGAGSLNAAPRGIGLGLALARELVERQGGKIGVQSQPQEGSLFSIYLPGAKEGTHALAA
jgi:signal transduction histidine kinase/HAMP domain-containing protein